MYPSSSLARLFIALAWLLWYFIAGLFPLFIIFSLSSPNTSNGIKIINFIIFILLIISGTFLRKKSQVIHQQSLETEKIEREKLKTERSEIEKLKTEITTNIFGLFMDNLIFIINNKLFFSPIIIFIYINIKLEVIQSSLIALGIFIWLGFWIWIILIFYICIASLIGWSIRLHRLIEIESKKTHIYNLTIIATSILILCLSFSSFPPYRKQIIYWYEFNILENVSDNNNIITNIEETNCEKYANNLSYVGKNKYYECILINQTPKLYTTEPINCTLMTDPSHYLTEKCSHLQTIQKAVIKNDDSLCSTMAPNFDKLYRGMSPEYSICIGHFPGSETWKSGCKFIKKTVQQGTHIENQLLDAQCLTKDDINSMLPINFDNESAMAPIWFNKNGQLDRRMAEYIKSLDVNFNTTDTTGKTMIHYFINNLHDFDTYIQDKQLPKKQLIGKINQLLKPLETLLQFGIDPTIKDQNGIDAFGFTTQNIKNPELQNSIIEIMKKTQFTK